MTQNHGDSRNGKSRHTTKITVKATVIMNRWLSYSANKCYKKCSRLRPLYTLRGFDSERISAGRIHFIGHRMLILNAANIYRDTQRRMPTNTQCPRTQKSRSNFGRKHNTYCTWSPSPRTPRKYPHVQYISGNSNHQPTFCRWQYGSSFVHIFLVGSVKPSHFYKSDVSAVQGHPRSLILVPIEGAYATSY